MTVPTIDLDVVLAAVADALIQPTGSPDTPVAQLALLDVVDSQLARARARVADARAAVIADAVTRSSIRQVAADLGVSPSAVAKAVGRARSQVPTDG